MKHYDKKPITSGSIQRAVNGKFGIPSQSLKRFVFELFNGKFRKVKKTAGNYMSLPKSSWSNTQNSPPQGQWGQSNELNA